ncbi:MAG: hypothetical protein JXB42_10460 [Deltaproteobacteria bacterium]|nr:hypothetical protein [Deltaproteobacteria bacterium]
MKNQIVVVVEGGIAVEAYSNIPDLNLEVLDIDTEKTDSEYEAEVSELRTLIKELPYKY